LQKDMKSYINSIGNGELQTFAIEMESKLAAAENAILEHKQNEVSLVEIVDETAIGSAEVEEETRQ
jgi:hypothetical protein